MAETTKNKHCYNCKIELVCSVIEEFDKFVYSRSYEIVKDHTTTSAMLKILAEKCKYYTEN